MYIYIYICIVTLLGIMILIRLFLIHLPSGCVLHISAGCRGPDLRPYFPRDLLQQVTWIRNRMESCGIVGRCCE